MLTRKLCGGLLALALVATAACAAGPEADVGARPAAGAETTGGGAPAGQPGTEFQAGDSANARTGATGQAARAAPAAADSIRLVLVVAVDQLRQDYLDRFRPYFGEGGFNLFFGSGATFPDAHYRHAVTKTAPGHAVILSGTYAHVNGIIANEWYDVEAGEVVYCVADTSVALLGVEGEGRSPRNFTGTTVGDALNVASAGRARVIAISNKDRSAILMGGLLADAAYWMEDSLFVSSTYYMDELPPWVRRFNASGAVSSYFGDTWERLLPAEAYTDLQGPDDVPAEDGGNGMGRTFPHRVNGGGERIGEGFFGAWESTPFPSEVLTAFAIRAMEEEDLGTGDATDLLAVSYSAADWVGHSFGPHSHEIMDMMIRTDRMLARLFRAVDERVGLEHTVVVLTADHGAAPMPEVILGWNPHASAGRVDPAMLAGAVNAALDSVFGSGAAVRSGTGASSGAAANPGGDAASSGRSPAAADWIANLDGPNLYLDPGVVAAGGATLREAEEVARDALQRLPGVHRAFTRAELRRMDGHAGGMRGVLLSFHPKRTGHVFYELKPFYLEGDGATGTSHGSPWSYDTHVPLLWYGAGVRPGAYAGRVGIESLAPTLSALLDVQRPAGARGRVLKEMLD